jgi:hypothetical protein
MISRTRQEIVERSVPIIISPKSATTCMNETFSNNYSLKENLFDPSKMSPPNDFMLNLQKRMGLYPNKTKNNATIGDYEKK